MNIVLKPNARKIIKRLIAEGRFASEQEAVDAAVRQLDDDLSWVDWERVQKMAAVGFAGLDRGEGIRLDRQGLKMLGEKIKREGRENLRRAKRVK
ncbi:MAG: hypothetical protein SFV19_16060 [Rhodospirillaceae bacterium]|nr:hypothetical protein [Rhodospirillaceae bacterium]